MKSTALGGSEHPPICTTTEKACANERNEARFDCREQPRLDKVKSNKNQCTTHPVVDYSLARLVCRNLLRRQAIADFQKENIVATRQVKSIFDYLPKTFTRKQFQGVVLKGGYKTDSSTLLCTFRKRVKPKSVIRPKRDFFFSIRLSF